MKLVSIIIPCYNEQDVLGITQEKLLKVLKNQKDFSWELVFVDDGSSDTTWEKIGGISESNRNVSGLKLSRNFGHQMATMAGIEAAKGDAVVIMDADLQDPPELILEFYKKWQEGFSVVYGKRKKRQGDSLFKKFTAGLFYRLFNKMSEVPIPLDTGDFRLIDRKIVDQLLAMPERALFLRGMVSWLGSDQCPVEYERQQRHAGKSKYPLRKMIRFATDGILSFSVVPLKLVTLIGLISFFLSIAGFIYAVILRLLTNHWEPGWTALFVSIFFFGGLQLLALGLIGEYVARIFMESKKRPLYVVEKTCGLPSNDKTPTI